MCLWRVCVCVCVSVCVSSDAPPPPFHTPTPPLSIYLSPPLPPLLRRTEKTPNNNEYPTPMVVQWGHDGCDRRYDDFFYPPLQDRVTDTWEGNVILTGPTKWKKKEGKKRKQQQHTHKETEHTNPTRKKLREKEKKKKRTEPTTRWLWLRMNGSPASIRVPDRFPTPPFPFGNPNPRYQKLCPCA
eukprot:TRINITY_DN10411_c0_g1_i1.p1 TRINITY_DN10411_c0_g1~~TRINITY_DN10411_c0_g1_i1.p1  ORF type:complete len:185 (-),score=12.35 TRINITY_DN10411_c0_g1_i1:255-809(-)